MTSHHVISVGLVRVLQCAWALQEPKCFPGFSEAAMQHGQHSGALQGVAEGERDGADAKATGCCVF